MLAEPCELLIPKQFIPEVCLPSYENPASCCIFSAVPYRWEPQLILDLILLDLKCREYLLRVGPLNINFGANFSFAFITDLRSQLERDVDQTAVGQAPAAGYEEE